MYNFVRLAIRWLQATLSIYLSVVWCQIVEINLSPVYGAIPSARWTSLSCCIAATVLASLIILVFPVQTVEKLKNSIPLLAQFCAILLHGFLYQFSSTLGTFYGPILTKAMIQLPLLVPALSIAMNNLFSDYSALQLALLARTLWKTNPFHVVDSLQFLLKQSRVLAPLSRSTLLVSATLAWAAMSPPTSRAASLAFAFGLVCMAVYIVNFDTHGTLLYSLQLANAKLGEAGFVILERQDSNTGYISVLENRNLGYRALRCDHSLLGGNWVVNEESIKNGLTEPETIFSVFTTLEAVRLMEQSEPEHTETLSRTLSNSADLHFDSDQLSVEEYLLPAASDDDFYFPAYGLDFDDHPSAAEFELDERSQRKAVLSELNRSCNSVSAAPINHCGLDSNTTKALVIGLGIGTCPSALSRHGITTTVVELDPAVTVMARKYFDLPDNITVLNEDALHFAYLARNNYYDFIVHDVFTGGAEPIALFTVEFLMTLRGLLRPGGFIAVNYAGDLKIGSTWQVLRTINHVFRTCQIYRDHEPDPSVEEDFANFVVFCAKRKAPWSFREPVKADFLGSLQRRDWLLPRYRVSLESYPGGSDFLSAENKSSQVEIILNHEKSAADHWRAMRKLLPDIVWETW